MYPSPNYTACVGTKLTTYLGAFNNSNSHDDTATFDSDSHQIIIDTGASATFTPSRDDFVSYTPFKGKVQGLDHMKIVGKGTVRYTIADDNGVHVQTLISNAHHIPNLPIKHISPQQVAQQSRDPLAGGYTTKPNYILAWDYHTNTVLYDKHNNLPVLHTTLGGSNPLYSWPNAWIHFHHSMPINMHYHSKTHFNLKSKIKHS
eukprot:7067366-Ditylum_brightwellii.AAC.1